MFVTQGVGCAPDQIEQSIATRFDMSAVLDIVKRPIFLSGRVVALVKQCVEGVEYQRLIFLLNCLTHNNFLILSLLAVLENLSSEQLQLARQSESFNPPSTGMLAPVL